MQLVYFDGVYSKFKSRSRTLSPGMIENLSITTNAFAERLLEFSSKTLLKRLFYLLLG